MEGHERDLQRFCGTLRRVPGNLPSLRLLPEQIHSVKDLERIPAIPTAYLKRNGDTVSVPYPRVIEVTSSGTSGKVSRVRYSFTEIFLCGIMSINMGLRHKLVSARPTHYIMLGYQPVRANKMVISKTAYLSSLFAFPISTPMPCVTARGAITWTWTP